METKTTYRPIDEIFNELRDHPEFILCELWSVDRVVEETWDDLYDDFHEYMDWEHGNPELISEDDFKVYVREGVLSNMDMIEDEARRILWNGWEYAEGYQSDFKEKFQKDYFGKIKETLEIVEK